MRRVSPPADDLAESLRSINVRSVVFCRSEFTAPWGFRVDDSAMAKFHLVLAGEAYLALDGMDEPHRLAAGDVVVIPHGTGHALVDAPGSPAPTLDGILFDHPVDEAGTMSYGGGGALTTVVCGGFGTDALPADLIEQLPRKLVLGSARDGMSRWLEPLAALLAAERPAAPGDSAVLAKVADVLLTESLRQYLASRRLVPVHVKAGDNDVPIAAALRMMRDNPGGPWTIAHLARAVGLSRTSFAVRFRDSVGEPPMTHLTRLRLSGGAGYLTSTTRTIGDIAREVGYDNEASFSKAFKRTYGRSPGAFRTSSWMA
jgi:AraC-like DNA-binding protein